MEWTWVTLYGHLSGHKMSNTAPFVVSAKCFKCFTVYWVIFQNALHRLYHSSGRKGVNPWCSKRIHTMHVSRLNEIHLGPGLCVCGDFGNPNIKQNSVVLINSTYCRPISCKWLIHHTRFGVFGNLIRYSIYILWKQSKLHVHGKLCEPIFFILLQYFHEKHQLSVI